MIGHVKLLHREADCRNRDLYPDAFDWRRRHSRAFNRAIPIPGAAKHPRHRNLSRRFC